MKLDPSRLNDPRHSAVRLLIALVLLILTSPFVEDLPGGDLIEAILLTVVMVSAVRAVGGKRRTFIIAVVLVAPILAGKWINHFRPDLVPAVAFLLPTVIFFGFVVAHLLRFLVRAPRVDSNVLCAGIAGFLMLGLLWTPLYVTVARLNPSAFAVASSPAAGTTLDGFNGFYFSFITLCTVGYGDITPVSRAAKMLAVVEAITGLFYMAVLISRLVSMHSSARDPGETD
ncbi:MAG TPA: potassium channel family protein [Verrucomicrobiota bacterium]|nr:hypothetical protein [Verrucomicrobiales bacterium]HRI11982.1 potassium channel family protein [Verrucomicrobiota bacterium]